MKISTLLSTLSLVSAFLLVSAPATGVDGIAVSARWHGSYDGFFGGYGSIWRHDIEDNAVTSHQQLHPGPARNVVISPSGDRVAFINSDGSIASMSIEGSDYIVLAQTHAEACLDWPSGDWIYYNLGGYHQPQTSRYLRRVNAATGEDQSVIDFDCGVWRFHISNDLSRAIVRDSDCFRAIVTYDMTNTTGILREENATDSPSCSEGLDPFGSYFIDGWPDHHGIDIRRWDNLNIVTSIAHSDANAWGGMNSGDEHDRNFWSSNSQAWLCMHMGWGIGWDPQEGWGTPTGANQVLYNWLEHERIVVTNNSEGDDDYDSAGDFWVRQNEPRDAGSGDTEVASDGASSRTDVSNQAPLVEAGSDQETAVGAAVLLVGQVSDDGQIFAMPFVHWQQQSGPAEAQLDNPNNARTMVHFDVAGTYHFTLTADDGEFSSQDDVDVTVLSPRIHIVHPYTAEVLHVGQTYHIEWNTVLVDDVTIVYSFDSGRNWQQIEFSIDRSSPQWGSYAWTVPDTPSEECYLMFTPYNGGGLRVLSDRFSIQTLPPMLDGDTAHTANIFTCGGCSASPIEAGCIYTGVVLLLLQRRRRQQAS